MVERKKFGENISLYRITNASGAYIEVLDYGAVWHSAFVPDRNGVLADVLLGARDENALRGFCMTGMVVGRCANRVAYGKFSVGGAHFQLDVNEGGNTLHSAGGNYGSKMFTLHQLGEDYVTLYCHDDGRAGFVSHAEVYVTYRFTDDNQVTIIYNVTPDGDTIVNLTNHAYFNLRGSGQVTDTVLQLNAERFTPKGATGMPEGGFRSVEGTPFDLREPVAIGQKLALDPEGLLSGTKENPQFDDNLALDGEGYRLAGSAYDPDSGRFMEFFTDMPGVQLYNPYAAKPMPGKYGMDEGYCAFCLETQYYPNAVNCPDYPSPVCRAGETSRSVTAYRFGVK